MSAPGEAGQMPPVGGGGPEPSEEELRAAYEAELSRITAVDMMAQATVTLLNIAARRLAPAEQAGEGVAASGAGTSSAEGHGPPAGRDLEQARDAIDAARALLAILERRIPRELGPLRDALSRLQMTFAREMGPGAPDGEAQPAPAGAPAASRAPAGEPQPAPAAPPGGAARPGEEGQRGPGPAESSGRLWVPGR